MQLFGLALSVALLDITLSGDNALIIAAAASHLPRHQRRLALLAGGTGAILLRILLTACASLLLVFPWLEGVGGILLILIAVRLLAAHSTDIASTYRSSPRFLPTLGMIILADLTMSLDNILALGALAHGNILALALGLVGSIGVLLVGSALIASLMRRVSWLIDVAALVLAWTAAGMLATGFHLATNGWISYVLVLASMLIATVWLRVLAAQKTCPILSFKRSKKS